MVKRHYSDESVLSEALIFVQRGECIVETAKFIGMPKSTLHHHIQKRLPHLDQDLWRSARKLLFINKHSRRRRHHE